MRITHAWGLWVNTAVRPDAIQNPILTPSFDDSNLSVARNESLVLNFEYQINPIEGNFGLLNQLTSTGDIDREEAESPFFDQFEGVYKTGIAIASPDTDEGSAYMILRDKFGGIDFWYGEYAID